jgi:hypothetical protein
MAYKRSAGQFSFLRFFQCATIALALFLFLLIQIEQISGSKVREFG